MDKRKSLAKTQRAVKHCVDKAEVSLSFSMRQCQAKVASIDSLQQYQQQYQQSLVQQAEKGISARQLQQIGQFVSHLQAAVVAETEQLKQLTRIADDKRYALTCQHSKQQALEQLQRQAQANTHQHTEKQEQVELDDRVWVQRALKT